MLKKIKTVLFALVGGYAAFQMVLAMISGTSAVHQIYGAAMAIVAILCLGFIGEGK